MPARFIDLEGIDQSGKKTQTRLLVSRLRREGFKTSSLSFPVYSTPSGIEIRAFLDGKRKYPPQAVHMLYSLNRWENQEEVTLRLHETDVLVADRYSASNLAYGLASSLELDWLLNLDKGLPAPDAVLVLDVPVGSSFARKGQGRDLHESNQVLLSKVRTNYLQLAKKFDWQIVRATGSADEVHARIWNSLKRPISQTREQ